MDRVECQRGEVDGLEFERAMLVEAGQREQIFDKRPHAGGFARDSLGRTASARRILQRTRVEQLGIELLQPDRILAHDLEVNDWTAHLKRCTLPRAESLAVGPRGERSVVVDKRGSLSQAS